MIAQRLSLPAIVEQKVIQSRQVAHVVGCYLNPEISDEAKALEFVTSDSSVCQILIEDDVNQVVNLLQHADKAL